MANLVIAGSKPRLASLLFDKVIPVPFDHLYHHELSLDGLLRELPHGSPELCQELLPRGMDADRYGIAILTLWVAITAHARGESIWAIPRKRSWRTSDSPSWGKKSTRKK